MVGVLLEASKIAGHSKVKITEDYTVVQLKRQDELTRRIQEKLPRAARRARQKIVLQSSADDPAA